MVVKRAGNLTVAFRYLPGVLLLSDPGRYGMARQELQKGGIRPCVYWAHYVLQSMKKRVPGLFRLFVTGEINAEVLGLAAVESRCLCCHFALHCTRSVLAATSHPLMQIRNVGLF